MCERDFGVFAILALVPRTAFPTALLSSHKEIFQGPVPPQDEKGKSHWANSLLPA